MKRQFKPINISDYKKFYENTIYKTNEGYYIKILEYNNSHNIIVQFLDTGFITTIHSISDIFKGRIHNPYRKNIYGGYIGEGKYTENNYRQIYNVWYSMQKRITIQDQYKNVYIDEKWYNFQNFAEFYYSKIKLLSNLFEYDLDKDIKQIGIYPKIYSENTCCIVPREINLIIMGIYHQNELPLGVVKNGNGYMSRMKINNNYKYLGTFSNPEEAFEVYKFNKLDYIKERALYYYNQNGLSLEDYNSIINMKLLPYNN